MKKAVGWIIRVIVSAAFFIAAVGKILDPYPFYIFIERALSIPTSWSELIRWITISGEITIGILIIFLNKKTGPVWLSTIVLLIFTGIIIYAKERNLDVDCGCFGAILNSHELGAHQIIRNLVLITLTALLIMLDKQGNVDRTSS